MNWPQRRMDDMVQFLNSRRIPVKAADRAKRQGPYPYYGASGIVDWVDDYIFDGEYLLVSEDGENLRSRNTPIAFMAKGKYWVNNHAHILDEKEPGILRYLGWALNRTDLSPYITGAAQPKLNKRTLETIEILVPPEPERLEINAILGALDDKIELNRKTAATLEAMARALYRSWFVDFDPVWAKTEGRPPAHMDEATAALFPESFGDDGLPVGWGMGTLIDVADLNPTTHTKKKHPEQIEYVDLANTKWGTIESTTPYEWENAPSRARMSLVTGDTIVGTVRPGNGSFSFVSQDGLTGSTGFAVLRPKAVGNAAFIYLAATDPTTIEALANLADGGAYPAVRPEVVAAQKVVLASEDVLLAFSAEASPLIARIEAGKKESQTLATLRDTLLPRLMSGELRMGDAREQVEAVA